MQRRRRRPSTNARAHHKWPNRQLKQGNVLYRATPGEDDDGGDDALVKS